MLLRLAPVFLAICLSAPCAVVSQYDTVAPLVLDGRGWSTQVTLVNLGKVDARILLNFSTSRGYAEPWKIGLSVTPGGPTSGNTVGEASVSAIIPPGAILTVESTGTPEALTRGYARLIVINNVAVGGTATLTRKADGAIAQTFTLPLSPESERKSSLPLVLNEEAGRNTELAFSSDSSYTRVDLTFRDPTGLIILEDSVLFDSITQLFVPIAETWPQLKNFRGSVEWVPSWPGLDIYENQYLSSTAVLTRKGAIEAIVGAMTLPDNQTKARRH